MSREYSGDITGSFWVAVQPSNAADRFGVIGEPPPQLDYSFAESDLSTINGELSRITEMLGNNLEKLEKFFQTHDCHNKTEVAEELGISELEAWKMVSEYADYKLGMEIKRCVERNGCCCFTANLE